MSDSEDEFASADEGDNVKHSPPAKVETENDTKKEPTVKEEPAQASGGKQNKKKGKGGKGGGGKQVKEDNPEANLKQQQQPQAVASAKGKKGKQKGKQGESSTAASKDTQKGAKSDNNEVPEKAPPKTCDSSPAPESIVENTQDGTHDEVDESVQESVSESRVKSDSEERVPATAESKPEDIEKVSTEKESKVNTEMETPTKPKTSEKVSTGKESEDNTDVETPTKSKTSDNLSLEEKANMIKSPSSQSISRPGPDHSQKEEDVLNKLASAATEKKTGWGWGWGSSILEVASSSVSTFTSQVGEGFNTVLETVESTLNVPSPEDLVKEKKEEAKKAEGMADTSTEDKSNKGAEAGKQSTTDTDAKPAAENQPEVSEEEVKPPQDVDSTAADAAGTQSNAQTSDSWFSSWGVSNVAKMVESTSKNIIHGGLDALETLGKKTFDVITEHDPGLKKARGFLRDRGDKPNLSAMLRDAKQHDEAMVKQEKENEEARKAHFGSLFDEFQGLAHLEALEILSNQSEKKVSTLLAALPPEAVGSLKPELMEIKRIFELGEEEEEEEDVEEHDFVKLVTDLLKEMNIGTTPDKMIKTQEKIRENLKEVEAEDDSEKTKQPKDIHQTAIQCLAELTSKSMEQFHKAGEMILLHLSKQPSLVKSSQQLHSLTKILCAEIGILSNKFTESLNKCADGDDAPDVSTLVTNVYLEASNSSSYIQDGFQLLLPVLQQAAIEKSQEPDQ